jgi:hypothetical protein
MADLLPLGFSGAGVVIAHLLATASLMRRSHIIDVIRSAELEGPDVLDDPALAYPVDAPIAEDTGAAGLLPRLKPAATR